MPKLDPDAAQKTEQEFSRWVAEQPGPFVCVAPENDSWFIARKEHVNDPKKWLIFYAQEIDALAETVLEAQRKWRKMQGTQS